MCSDNVRSESVKSVVEADTLLLKKEGLESVIKHCAPDICSR